MVFGFFKGEKVNLSIELDRPGGPYYPGDVVNALITLRGEKDMKVREVRAGLAMQERYTYQDEDSEEMVRSYKTSAQSMVAQDTLLGETVIASDFERTFQCGWQIPADAVPPYSGEITSNRWLAKVTCDRKLKGDVNEEVEVNLVVPPPGLAMHTGEFRETGRIPEADLVLWLPRREWVEGDSLEGRLSVRPGREFDVREVRIALVRQEQVFKGEGNLHEITAAEGVLAGGTRFRPAEPADYPFSLTVASQGCPSRRTEHSLVTWRVEATLSRRLHKENKVSAEIFVYNGRAAS